MTTDNVHDIDDAGDIAWLANRRRILAFRKATDISGHPPGWLVDQLDADFKRSKRSPKDAA